MHGTYISYWRRAILGTSALPLLSLRAATCYLLASAFHRLCWLSHIMLQSGRSANLRALRWYNSIERLAGVGYLLSVHLAIGAR